METKSNFSSLIELALALVIFTLPGCADFAGPSYGGGYREPYYQPNYYDDDDYRRREHDRREHREMEKERERLDEEKDRIRRERDEERRREERERQREQEAQRQRQQEHCPSGFQPSERKCSQEERRRGCKDVRLSSGLGCVKR